jgi:hypothetical protein
MRRTEKKQEEEEEEVHTYSKIPFRWYCPLKSTPGLEVSTTFPITCWFFLTNPQVTELSKIISVVCNLEIYSVIK